MATTIATPVSAQSSICHESGSVMARVTGIGGIFIKARDAVSFRALRFGWVADPEGNRIELWEPPLAG